MFRRHSVTAALRVVFCLVLMLWPALSRAVPDTEKIALTGKATETGAISTVIYQTFGYILVANRTTHSVSFFDLATQKSVKDAAGAPLVLDVANDPVAIAVYDNATMLMPTPTVAYAFVAGYSSNKISVINLLATPPAVMSAEEVNVALDSDSVNPGPLSLLVDGTNLFVANGGEGTIIQYAISAVSPVLTQVSFGVAMNDQTTTGGNLIVCTVGDSLPLAGQGKPRTMLRYSSRNFVGCSDGTVSHFQTSGDVSLRGDIYTDAGAAGLMSVRGLAGDPRTGTNILYVLDDESDGVFAIDVDPMSGIFEDTMVDPAIVPVCSSGGSDSDLIPTTADIVSTSLVSFHDPSATGGGDFLAVLGSATGTTELQIINLSSIDRDAMTNSECAIGGASTISSKVNLSLGNAYFPPAAVPAGIVQQIFHHVGYIGIPNYSVTNGIGVLTFVTDAPVLSNGTVSVSALAPAKTAPFNTENVMTTLAWNSSETIQSSPVPTVNVRIRNEPLSFVTLSHTTLVGDVLSITTTSANLVSSGVVSASDNEYLEILVGGADTTGDSAFAAAEIVFDSTPPTGPSAVTVLPGDSLLQVTATGMTDPDPGNGVRSQLGGFFVHYTAAVDMMMNPVSPLPVNANISTLGATFNLLGLQNDVTYTFDVYALDQAGNISAAMVTASGTPVPGLGIAELTGETGCSFQYGRRNGLGMADGLILGLALFLPLLLRRRRKAQ